MLAAEFDLWLENHLNAHPELRAWLARGTNSSVVTFWRQALDRVPLSDAKDVTRRMAVGELDEPKGFSKHGAYVAKYARESAYVGQTAATAISGERVYSCPMCLDDGLVAVVDPVAYRAGQFRPCSVYCTCPTGDMKQRRRLSSGRRATIRPRFDAARMFRLDYDLSTEQARAEFETWL